MVIRRKSKQKRNRSSKRRTSRSKRVSKRTSRRKKTSRRKSKKKTSRKKKSLRKRNTSRKKKSINRRGGMIGFLNSSDTQASIGNDTKILPTPASTMNTGDLRRLDAAAAGARSVYPYSPHDIVQTPEAAAAAASRTNKFVFDNSIPAKTDAQRAEDNKWWNDAAKAAKATAKVALIVAPAVLAAQERNKQKK